VVNGHSFIPIRRMAALVRRVLVEVCTVPVLLDITCGQSMRTDGIQIVPFSWSFTAQIAITRQLSCILYVHISYEVHLDQERAAVNQKTASWRPSNMTNLQRGQGVLYTSRGTPWLGPFVVIKNNQSPHHTSRRVR